MRRKGPVTPEYILSCCEVNPETGCVEWGGPLNDRGYGLVSIGGRKRRAHRVLYCLEVRPLGDEEVLRHSCDNRRCCNLEHLVPGTQIENIQDMLDRGRGCVPPPRFGVEHPKAKLTEQQLAQLLDDPRPVTEVAKSYGIHRSTVRRIKRRHQNG